MKETTTTLLFLFLLTGGLFAQKSFIVKEVRQAQEKHELREAFDLNFKTTTTAKAINSQQAIEAVLDFDKNSLRKLISSQSEYLELSISGLNGDDIPVSLVKSEIFTPDFRVTVDAGTSKYDYPVDLSETIYYRGIVDGDAHSLVALSLSDGTINGFINSTDHGDLGLKKNEFGQNIMVDLTSLDHQELACGTQDDGQGYAPEMLRSPSNYRDAGDYVSIFIEVESDVVDWQGGTSQALNYITNLFNESAAIYAGDGIDKRISEIEINTTPEYVTRRGKREIKPSSSSAYLDLFQQAKASTFNGDLAQLVVYNNVGGVAAGFSGLCNSNRANSMCMSGFVSDYFFNLQIFAHELGHLFGSRHTHACVWNGNNTAIDGCSGSTEGTCALPPPAGQNEGTIMSYCYNNYGLDFNEGFHPQPAAVMQNNVVAASCLMSGSGGGNTCFDGVQNGNETGVDCGGPDCVACPTCNDGVLNGNEVGVDCGGPDCPACPPVSCDDPTNLQVRNMRKNRGVNRGILDWSDIGDALSYDVRIRTAGTTAWSDFSATESSLSLEGFGEGVEYEWEVRASCIGATSNYVGCTFTYVARGADVNCSSGASGPAISNSDLGEILNVSPNPVNDILLIQMDNMHSESYQLDIFNAVGQRVFNSRITQATNWVEVNVQDYDAGLYLISVSSNSNRHLKRVIVN